MSEKKLFHKKWWFWVIAALLVLGVIGSIIEDEDEKEESQNNEVADSSTENEAEGNQGEHTTKTEISFFLDNHLVVAGSTDLPDGEEVVISVTSEANGYRAADTQLVEYGTYVSEVFTDKGDSLPGGEYIIKVKAARGYSLDHEEAITIE